MSEPKAQYHAGDIKAVEKPHRLTKRQRVFIDEYLKSGNATKSALAAGYSPKTAYSHGARLLKNVEIKDAIDLQLSASHMSAQEVIKGISDIARGDMADLMDITTMGFTLKLAHVDEETGDLIINPNTKLIKKIKQRVTTFIAKKESEEDREVIETELELYSALEAKALLGKYHKLFTDKVDITSQGDKIYDPANLLSRLLPELANRDQGRTTEPTEQK